MTQLRDGTVYKKNNKKFYSAVDNNNCIKKWLVKWQSPSSAKGNKRKKRH